MSTTAAPMTTLTGSCYCGNITYEIRDVPVGPLDGIICHCRTCQKLNTMASYNVAFGADQLKVTKGIPTKWDDHTADSGFRMERNFCGTCGSSLFACPDSKPDIVFVKAGSLDKVDKVKPATEIFVERMIVGSTAASSDRKTTLFEGMMAKQIS